MIYGKIYLMKYKKLTLVSGLLAAAALVYAGKHYVDAQKEAKLAQIIKEVRAFFATFGDIATVYIDQQLSGKVETKGGVVMTDGQVYQFDYLAGEIFYKETAL